MADDPCAHIVGAGPAGLAAAEVLAQRGFRTTVFDQRRSPARKFVLAGRGGLNITHGEPFEALLGRYRTGGGAPAPQQLVDALTAFGPSALRTWCAALGEPTFVGSSGRVFPSSFRALPLLRSWLAYLDELGVELRLGTQWRGIDASEGHLISRFGSVDGDEVAPADVVVLALGGASWPRVGGDGSWLPAIEQLGVSVEPMAASNVGVDVGWTPVFADRHEGSPVKNVRVVLDAMSARGDLMVTRSGLEGGPIYALSAGVRRALDVHNEATIEIDLAADRSLASLVERIGVRRPKESTATLLRRSGLAPVGVALMRESAMAATGAPALPDSVEELAALAKAVPVTVRALMPIERAISSVGGVGFDQIDNRFMLRACPGVFVAGEMLDWDAPTGGYLLQGCFSTGVAAANGAVAWAIGS